MDEKRTIKLSIIVDDETKTWLEKEAERQWNISVASLIRQIIDFYRKNYHPNGNGQSPVNSETNN